MQTTGLPPVSRGSVPSRASRASRGSQDERRSRRSRASMESRGSSKRSRRRGSMDTAGSVRFVPKEEAVRLMVWDWCTGNEEELDAILRIQKNWRKSRRMKLLQRHPYRKHVTPDGTFFYSKRDDPSQVTWCAPHVPDRHGLPIAYRDEAAMKALAAANAEYQKNRAAEKAKRQVFIDIIKEKHAVGKRRRDEEAARAARALFDKRWGDAFEFAREVRGAASASYFESIWSRRWHRSRPRRRRHGGVASRRRRRGDVVS